MSSPLYVHDNTTKVIDENILPTDLLNIVKEYYFNYITNPNITVQKKPTMVYFDGEYYSGTETRYNTDKFDDTTWVKYSVLMGAARKHLYNNIDLSTCCDRNTVKLVNRFPSLADNISSERHNRLKFGVW